MKNIKELINIVIMAEEFAAKEFIIRNKSWELQCKRIVEFILGKAFLKKEDINER